MCVVLSAVGGKVAISESRRFSSSGKAHEYDSITINRILRLSVRIALVLVVNGSL